MQFKNKISKLIFLNPGLGICTTSSLVGDDYDEIMSQSSADHTMDSPIHADMEAVVEKIKIHLARLTGLFGAASKESSEKLFSGKQGAAHREILLRLRVKSVTYDLGEDTDKPRVQIQGNFITPWDEKKIASGTSNMFLNATTYDYADQLLSELESLNDEAFAYARGDKRGGDPTLFAVPVLPIFIPMSNPERPPIEKDTFKRKITLPGVTVSVEKRDVYNPEIEAPETDPEVANDLGGDAE